MSCNKYKNSHYKSALQFFNTTDQAVTATDLVTSPVLVDLGQVITDTGCAFDLEGRSFNVESSGLYQFYTEISILGVTAGDITVAMTIDGIVAPETAETVTLVAGTTDEYVLNTIRQLNTCFSIDNHRIGYIAYSDGTGVGTITRVSGNAVKLA